MVHDTVMVIGMAAKWDQMTYAACQIGPSVSCRCVLWRHHFPDCREVKRREARSSLHQSVSRSVAQRDHEDECMQTVPREAAAEAAVAVLQVVPEMSRMPLFPFDMRNMIFDPIWQPYIGFSFQ
jgi:hypothetical protein